MSKTQDYYENEAKDVYKPVKKCYSCGELKELSMYRDRAVSKDGKVSSCLSCCAARSAIMYDENKKSKDNSPLVLGTVFRTKSYGNCEFISLLKGKCTVRFLNTNNVAEFATGNLRMGLIKDNMAKIVCGVGYIGNGTYVARTSKGCITPEYACWQGMLRRCYEPMDEMTERNYGDCDVCPEWHNFQNFAQWCQGQQGFNTPEANIDKDILVVGNRTYGPNGCCFVPRHLNAAVTGSKHTNVSGYVGVSETDYGRFTSSITLNNTGVHLGIFDTKEQAFAVYKSMKEAYIRTLSEVYKARIRRDVYESVKMWEVKE